MIQKMNPSLGKITFPSSHGPYPIWNALLEFHVSPLNPFLQSPSAPFLYLVFVFVFVVFSLLFFVLHMKNSGQPPYFSGFCCTFFSIPS